MLVQNNKQAIMSDLRREITSLASHEQAAG
jgi:hypothetical protein